MNSLADPVPSHGSPPHSLGPFVTAFAPWEQPAAGGKEPGWVVPFRKAGLARFADLGLPTTRHEDWRYTSLAPLAALPFRPARGPAAHGVGAADLERLPLADLSGTRLVFVDGHLVPPLSRTPPLGASVRVQSLSETLRAEPGWIELQIGRLAESQDRALVALNDAYFTDGLVVRVAANSVVAEPIHAIFISTGQDTGRAAHLRNFIVAEPHAQVSVVEEYVSLGTAPTFTNTVTHLIAGEGSHVEHVRFQEENPETFHLGALRAVAGRNANLAAHSFALGARLARQSIGLVLDGPGLEAILNGLYVTNGTRLADHHMVVDHAQPHCASHEYFNGILSDQARGVFHGRILVRPGAQKTDAKQTNKNLLLSEGATVNTKPQLEIYADDVKCTHGATIGQLNPESLFYLRARGLPLETARRMLIHAFAGEIIDRVRCAPVRQALDRLVWERLERDERVHLEN